jgi:hypothetical protein
MKKLLNSSFAPFLCIPFGAICFTILFALSPSKLTANQPVMINDPRWPEFLECSKDQGDMGCDSCYFAIFGVHSTF